MYRGSNHGPSAFSCVPPARSLGEILARFCGFSRCYGQENFPSVFLALTSPVAHAEGSGAMMRSCSSRPRHRASAIAECAAFGRQKAGANSSSASSDFKSLGAFFWPLGHWSLSTLAFSQLSVGAHGPPRGRVPDVVASRLLRPHHFPALIQSFQSVAAPFPGNSGFDRDCGARRSVGQRQAPRSRLAGEPIRRPSAGRKIRDGTMRTLSVYRKQATRDSARQKHISQKSVIYLFWLRNFRAPQLRVERVPRGRRENALNIRVRRAPPVAPSGSGNELEKGARRPTTSRRLDSRDPVTVRTRRATRVWPPPEFHAPRWKGSCRRD